MDYLQTYNAANFDSGENLVAFLAKLHSMNNNVNDNNDDSNLAAPTGLDQLLIATSSSSGEHAGAGKSGGAMKRRSSSAATHQQQQQQQQQQQHAHTPTSTTNTTAHPLPSDANSVYSSIRGVLVSSLPQPTSAATSSSSTTRCKCKRSHCLKFYCSCFETNQLCVPGECSCAECWNTARPEHIMSRADAVLTALEKNAQCFSGKSGVSRRQAAFKGCHCKKSGCLKKYCDCYVAGTKCKKDVCRCENCENGGGEDKDKDKLRTEAAAVLVAALGGGAKDDTSSSDSSKRVKHDNDNNNQ